MQPTWVCFERSAKKSEVSASGTFEGMRELLQVEVVTPSKRQNIEEVFHAAVGDPQNDHRLEFLRNNALYWVGAHDRWAQR
jgi:hypothetical protein